MATLFHNLIAARVRKLEREKLNDLLL